MNKKRVFLAVFFVYVLMAFVLVGVKGEQFDACPDDTLDFCYSASYPEEAVIGDEFTLMVRAKFTNNFDGWEILEENFHGCSVQEVTTRQIVRQVMRVYTISMDTRACAFDIQLRAFDGSILNPSTEEFYAFAGNIEGTRPNLAIVAVFAGFLLASLIVGQYTGPLSNLLVGVADLTLGFYLSTRIEQPLSTVFVSLSAAFFLFFIIRAFARQSDGAKND